METALLIIASMVLGGVGRRIAGGYLNQLFYGQTPTSTVMGDTPARLIFGLMVALAGVLGGMSLWAAPLMVLAVWLGSTTGNNNSLEMGRGSNSYWSDFWGMTYHALDTQFAISVVGVVNYWIQTSNWVTFSPLIASAFIMLAAPIYTLGWAITGNGGAANYMPVGFKGSTEIAEFLWGCAIGAGVMLSFMI